MLPINVAQRARGTRPHAVRPSAFRPSTVFLFAALMLVLAVIVAGCAAPPAPQAPAANAPSTQAAPASAEPTAAAGQKNAELKIALLPVMDVLPFHVAQKNGYFAEEGLAVEGVPVKSAQERDTLMQTGQVDGQLTDLIGPVLFNKDKPAVKVVYTARRAYPDSPMFSIIAGPKAGIKTPADLKGKTIGISQNTVIEYLTDRMLQAEGLTPDEIKITEVSAIPVRFELLMKGELPAAGLPDPLASGAVAAGAVSVVADSKYPQYAQSVLVFSQDALQNKPDAVKKFLKAWDRAAGEINANPDAYKDLLIEVGRVPESVQGTFAMPPFPQGSITSQSEMQDVVDWMVHKGKIENAVSYENLVDPTFMPAR